MRFQTDTHKQVHTQTTNKGTKIAHGLFGSTKRAEVFTKVFWWYNNDQDERKWVLKNVEAAKGTKNVYAVNKL